MFCRHRGGSEGGVRGTAICSRLRAEGGGRLGNSHMLHTQRWRGGASAGGCFDEWDRHIVSRKHSYGDF